jgi:hypothetical protein
MGFLEQLDLLSEDSSLAVPGCYPAVGLGKKKKSKNDLFFLKQAQSAILHKP